jgi:hypothetical protein
MLQVKVLQILNTIYQRNVEVIYNLFFTDYVFRPADISMKSMLKLRNNYVLFLECLKK